MQDELPTQVPNIAGQAPSLLNLLLTSQPNEYKVSVYTPLANPDHYLVETSVLRFLPPRPRKLGVRIGTTHQQIGMVCAIISHPYLGSNGALMRGTFLQLPR